jgi:arginyl-tRNA synthetase
LTAFPNLPNQFDIQIETVNNQLHMEYKTPTVIRIFNQFKKQNLFGGIDVSNLDVKT